MVSALLVSYFINQFQYPTTMPFRQDQSIEYVRTTEARGALTVKASSARVGTVAPGSQRIEMLRLQLTASCADDIPINTISVQRRGLGANSDIAAVYVMHRGVRVSVARTVAQRNGVVDLNLRRFTLPACESEDMYIYADFAADAAIAGEHSFVLHEVDAGKATVRIDEQKGEFIRETARTVGRSVGQISVEYRTVNQRVHYGSRQRIARFTLSADGVDDHLVQAITFTNNGSASDDDLQNLFIDFRNRRVTGITPQMSGDKVRMEFDPPFSLPKNSTLLFSVGADVRASRSRTIQFVIEEPSDIEAVPDVGR